jgi:DNA-binding transcriptional ArsR family regulator
MIRPAGGRGDDLCAVGIRLANRQRAEREGAHTVPRKKPHPLLTDEALELMAGRFRALGDPTRLRILNLLMRGERSVQELVEQSGVPQTSVSRNLGVLRREGVVSRKPVGNRALYRITDPTVVRICDIVCGGLRTRLSDEIEALGSGI